MKDIAVNDSRGIQLDPIGMHGAFDTTADGTQTATNTCAFPTVSQDKREQVVASATKSVALVNIGDAA